MLLTIFLFLLVLGIISAIFVFVDTESPYIVHLVAHCLSISLFLFLGFQCIFRVITIDLVWFFQNIIYIGALLVALGSVLFIYLLFEFANYVKMKKEVSEER